MMHRLCLSVILLFVIGTASASFTWTGGPNDPYGNPEAVCSDIWASNSSHGENQYLGAKYDTVLTYRCVVNVISGGIFQGEGSIGFASRQGVETPPDNCPDTGTGSPGGVFEERGAGIVCLGNCKARPGLGTHCDRDVNHHTTCTAPSFIYETGGLNPCSGGDPPPPAYQPPDTPPPPASPPDTPPTCGAGMHPEKIGSLTICLPDVNPPSFCPPGQVKGDVNGVATCLPGGEGYNTGGNTKVGADGSTTTTTTTTSCSGAGSCTTTTTSGGTNPPTNGGPAGSGTPKPNTTTSEVQDKPSFCQEHPKDKLCSGTDSSANFGPCDSPPSCDGDAITCAIARQVFEHKCIDAKASKALEDSGQYTLGNQAMAGNDPRKNDFPTPENGDTVNVGSFNATGFLGGGSCFQDYTISFQGSALTIPFSLVCEPLGYARPIVLIIALIISMYIVSGAVRKGA